jgi:thiol-disulfide isomerase/thioredoxin
MKKYIVSFLILFCSIINAQHSIKGLLSPNIESDWLIVYKIEGTKQVFVNNTKIKTDSILVNGIKKEVGKFEITLPSSAKPGSYRATYRLEGAGFVDFIYNKEDVSFAFNPNYPNQTVSFSKSEENKLFNNYITSLSITQQKLDSMQIAVLQNTKLDLKKPYKDTYNKLIAINNDYLAKAKGKFVYPLIKASLRNNSPEILTNTENYMSRMKNTFFDKIDFSDKTLINSSFLINRILDYVFFINYSDDKKTQQILYKSSIEKVLSKIDSQIFKRDIIMFLIDQFEAYKNFGIIDYLFKNHYDKLPSSLKDNNYKKEKIAAFASEIGRIAPDFSWSENGRNFKLSTLNDAEKYVLVFWSTSCSHCLREIPELHSFMKNKKGIKVIAFALENSEFAWKQYSNTNLRGWYNVLGLNKWKNKTARTYQVNSTPTYFILDKNKKIIAKPYEFVDVKAFFEKQ